MVCLPPIPPSFPIAAFFVAVADAAEEEAVAEEAVDEDEEEEAVAEEEEAVDEDEVEEENEEEAEEGEDPASVGVGSTEVIPLDAEEAAEVEELVDALFDRVALLARIVAGLYFTRCS